MQPSADSGSGALTSSSSSSSPVAGVMQAFPTGWVLLRDSLAAPGHFLLPGVVAAAVQQGHCVLVLASAWSPRQHAAALRKVGISSNSSSVRVVSAAAAFKGLNGDGSISCAASAEEQLCHRGVSPLQRVYVAVHDAACELLQHAQQQLEHQQQPPATDDSSSRRLTVVVDSLPCLAALAGGDSNAVGALLHHLGGLAEALQLEQQQQQPYGPPLSLSPGRLVVLAGADVPAHQQLLAAAAARSHVTLDIRPLEGRTAALDGSLAITIRRPPAATLGGSGSMMAAAAPHWLRPGSSSIWWFRCGDVGVTFLSEVAGKELMA